MSNKDSSKNTQYALPFKGCDAQSKVARAQSTIVTGRFVSRDNHLDAVSRRLSQSGVFSAKSSNKKD